MSRHSELRKADQLIRMLDRLRTDMARRESIGYGTRTRTSSADIRRRDLNRKIIFHLHAAHQLNEREHRVS